MAMRQPFLHDATVALRAPGQAWSRPDGDMTGGIDGLVVSDVRLLAGLRLTVGGSVPEPVLSTSPAPDSTTSTALLRDLDESGADPRVRLDRDRRVHPAGLVERYVVRNATRRAVTAAVEVRLRPDATPMDVVKAGAAPAAVVPTRSGDSWSWGDAETAAHLVADDAAVEAAGDELVLRWSLEVPAGGSAGATWSLDVVDGAPVVVAAPDAAPFRHAPTGDAALDRWLDRALADLGALRMALPDAPDDVFLAAGAPWFFTLFGRDSIWAARLLLPVDTGVAAGTLRVLARMQGTHSDPETAEQPGKILHELRRAAISSPGEGFELPPRYYGTVDATPLFVLLLHDAWRAGLPDEEVRALLPNMRAALAWMRDSGDADGDGFLEYVDETGRGLANQGWKDSGDSVQWRDGTLATGPIALCEVQGYAHEAAEAGAAILDAFAEEGGDEWRAFAARLRDRFREAFWVDDGEGGFPAIALDAEKRRVDSLTSNIGHLLGTGLLGAADEARVAALLVDPRLDSGFGLRTLATDAAGYWPLSYHGGSVWTHDTAIAIAGLTRAGFAAEAATLAEGLLRAAAAFDSRMPELHSGDAFDGTPGAAPAPYPAACRPQAWSAAAAVPVAAALLAHRSSTPTTQAAPQRGPAK